MKIRYLEKSLFSFIHFRTLKRVFKTFYYLLSNKKRHYPLNILNRALKRNLNVSLCCRK